MQKGLWDPEGSTATAYAWVVWLKPFVGIEVRDEARMIWIPPGQQIKHHRNSDVAKFVKYVPMPLFDGLPPALLETPAPHLGGETAPMLELLAG